MKEICDTKQVHELAENPLLLTMIVHVSRHSNGELPTSRFALYETDTGLALNCWHATVTSSHA